jgi:hypothetical protein
MEYIYLSGRQLAQHTQGPGFNLQHSTTATIYILFKEFYLVKLSQGIQRFLHKDIYSKISCNLKIHTWAWWHTPKILALRKRQVD